MHRLQHNKNFMHVDSWFCFVLKDAHLRIHKDFHKASPKTWAEAFTNRLRSIIRGWKFCKREQTLRQELVIEGKNSDHIYRIFLVGVKEWFEGVHKMRVGSGIWEGLAKGSGQAATVFAIARPRQSVTHSLTALGLPTKVNCQGKGTGKEVKASLAVQVSCLDVIGFSSNFLQSPRDERIHRCSQFSKITQKHSWEWCCLWGSFVSSFCRSAKGMALKTEGKNRSRRQPKELIFLLEKELPF